VWPSAGHRAYAARRPFPDTVPANGDATFFESQCQPTEPIPFLPSFFPVYAAARGVKVYDEFVDGAKEAFNVIMRIIPFW
jgi:hypothetical protein